MDDGDTNVQEEEEVDELQSEEDVSPLRLRRNTSAG
jgi:hypothetical protein